MATDPSIILAGGQINDPARLAQSQMLQYQAMQQRRAMQGQNVLKQIFAHPGAMTPDGMVSPNAIAQIMRVDPNTGLEMAKQNRAAQLDQLHIKAAELGNQLSQTEIGKAKWDFMTNIAAATADAYDQAVKGGADPQRALAAATATRDRMIRENGGQMSEQEEQQALSRPLNMDEARAIARQNKDYVGRQDRDREFGLESDKFGLEKTSEAFREKTETQRLGYEGRRVAVEERQEAREEREPKSMGNGVAWDPERGFIDTTELGEGGGQYTGGWTPRARNGGDNSDAAVDNKIAGAAKYLGVAPDQDISKIDPRRIAMAMTLSEGGKGSLADRNNNPGNLKGKDGYQRFPSKQAGFDAAVALVKRKIATGQTSVKTLVEGLPVHGGGEPKDAEMARSIANYDLALPARLISTARGQRIMREVLKINPDYDQTLYNAKNKFVSGLGSQQPGTSGGKITAGNTVVQHLGLLQTVAAHMANGNVQAVNSLRNMLKTQFGSADVTNFNLVKQFVVNETLKAAAGGVLTGEDRQTMLSNLSSSGSWAQLSQATRLLTSLVGAQMESVKTMYGQLTHKNDFDRFLSPRALAVLRKTNPDAFGSGKPSVSNW